MSKKSKTILLSIFVVAILISLMGFAYFYALVAGASIVFLLILVIAGFKIKDKGIIGERTVAKFIEKCAYNHYGKVINNIIIPAKNGATSQIDHILFLKSGIYVIETKNYSGRIYGNSAQREWTQVLAFGKTKNKLYNPCMQNETHVRRLRSTIGAAIPIYSCVVFVGGMLYIDDIPNLYTFTEFKRYIKKELKKGGFDLADIYKVFNKINYFKTNPIQTEEEHVKEIKRMQEDINNNICPRCGGKLLLREGKTGFFYGCSNYPRCKFIKKG